MWTTSSRQWSCKYVSCLIYSNHRYRTNVMPARQGQDKSSMVPTKSLRNNSSRKISHLTGIAENILLYCNFPRKASENNMIKLCSWLRPLLQVEDEFIFKIVWGKPQRIWKFSSLRLKIPCKDVISNHYSCSEFELNSMSFLSVDQISRKFFAWMSFHLPV